MFDWMGDDVKWVFSGIGVFVLSILVAVVWHFLKRRSAGHNDRTGGAVAMPRLSELAKLVVGKEVSQDPSVLVAEVATPA